MTFQEAEKTVHSFTRFGSQLSLARMRKLLEKMGNPQDKCRYIHIAGTNGKGSTAKMTANVLERAGYRVGLYTSPFVVEFRERYQCNGKMIEKEDFAYLVETILPYVRELSDEGEEVTEFEMVTAVGFAFFLQEDCDLVVLEVGIGGRFDATNVIAPPLVGVITSISLDHTKILGESIAEIAAEKAGIIKKGTTMITYPKQEPEAIAVFMERVSILSGELILPNPGAIEILRQDLAGSQFQYGDDCYLISLVGEHQIYNAVTVIEIIRALRKKGIAVSEAALKEGLFQTRFPGRFEIVSQNPLIVLDGAHNPSAAEALSKTLNSIVRSPKVGILGMLEDKDYQSSARQIASSCDNLVLTPIASNKRAVSPLLLKEAISGVCSQVYCSETEKEAFSHAKRLAGDKGMIIVSGSFYLVSDIRRIALEENLK